LPQLLADTMVSRQAPSGLTTWAQDAPNAPFYVVLKQVELRLAERVAASKERISSQVQRVFSCPKMYICLTLSADLAASNSTVATPQLIPSGAVDILERPWNRVARRPHRSSPCVSWPQSQQPRLPYQRLSTSFASTMTCGTPMSRMGSSRPPIASALGRLEKTPHSLRENAALPAARVGAPLCTTNGCLVDGCSTNCDAFYGKYVVRFMSPARGMTRWFVRHFMYTYPKEGGNYADLRPKANGIIWNQDSR
jgi:hypothetical protein